MCALRVGNVHRYIYGKLRHTHEQLEMCTDASKVNSVIRMESWKCARTHLSQIQIFAWRVGNVMKSVFTFT